MFLPISNIEGLICLLQQQTRSQASSNQGIRLRQVAVEDIGRSYAVQQQEAASPLTVATETGQGHVMFPAPTGHQELPAIETEPTLDIIPSPLSTTVETLARRHSVMCSSGIRASGGLPFSQRWGGITLYTTHWHTNSLSLKNGHCHMVLFRAGQKVLISVERSVHLPQSLHMPVKIHWRRGSGS